MNEDVRIIKNNVYHIFFFKKKIYKNICCDFIILNEYQNERKEEKNGNK